MRRSESARACLLTLVLALVGPHEALAAWPNSPFTNLPLCKAISGQGSPTIASDGTGGAIVTWLDHRGGTYDIYAQHVLASGVVDPAWTTLNGNADGTPLCTAVNDQLYPRIASDGTGGAIVTWQDLRGGATYDIYAQHVLASGAVDPAWTVLNGNANGTPLCTAANHQSNPAIVSDGAGGAIVTWYDFRGGVSYDIYAQHVLASGAVDPAWTVLNGNANGTPLCTAVGDQTTPTIVADGAKGAIVTWHDLRSGTNLDIYAQHVLASGAVDPAWTALNGNANGTPLCTAVADQLYPAIASDGVGGALVAWMDNRSGQYDIYAQHVLSGGAADPTWTANGSPLCTATADQIAATIVSDGAGGAIVAWADLRAGNYDMYAQHLLASGTVDPAWTALNGNANGTPLCTAANEQDNSAIVSDGAGGAIVTWYDYRGGSTSDIYAHHVLASGAADPAWPANGRALSTASNLQWFATTVTDGAGGAITAWQDLRSGSYDIYAQRVARYGYLGTPEAEIIEVKDVPNDNGGRIKLAWNASYLDLNSDPNLAAYDIYRSVPPNLVASAAARGIRVVTSFDQARRPGDALVAPASAQIYSWEYVGTVNPNHFASSYSYLVPSAEDSTSFGNPRTAFLVLSRNSANTMFWPSRPDSGYSVDNLPPLAPAPFTGNYSAGVAHLHWNPNTEGDLANYRLYRGTSPGFTPSLVNRIATPPDTGYADAAGSAYYYKLSAVDIHGNESGFTTLLPAGTLDAPGGALPRELALERPAPNPASGSTTLRYALPRAARVTLAIYDAAGRRVRSLVAGTQPAGEHGLNWDLRDDAGRGVGAGLYFVRFEAEGRSFTQRMATLR